MVVLTEDAKKAYGIFSYLRENCPKVDVCTLRHVSVYIAKTNDKFEVDNDLHLFTFENEGTVKLSLSNGTNISLINSCKYPLFFLVERQDEEVEMTMIVSSDENSSTIFSSFNMGEWQYIVGNSDDKMKNYIQVFHNGNYLADSTSYFEATTEDDISLDCIDGLGHLTSVMMRIDLLYNNLRAVKNNKLVRKK